MPRSSRVSRDLEKMLSRFSGFGFGADSVVSCRTRCNVCGKTGVGDVAAIFVFVDFINWENGLRRLAFETRAVIRFEPVERGVCFRIEHELGATLDEVSAF